MYFSEEGLLLSNGTKVVFNKPKGTFLASPFTVSFHWRSREFVNSEGALAFSGVIAKIPIGEIRVSWGTNGLEISLDADKKYVLTHVQDPEIYHLIAISY